jgi:hypothetical protein
LESNRAPGVDSIRISSCFQVGDYYQRALAKYGAVLDCTNAARPQQAKDENSEKLTCGDDKPEMGGMLSKGGTKEKQHIVGVQPNGTGAVFQLLGRRFQTRELILSFTFGSSFMLGRNQLGIAAQTSRTSNDLSSLCGGSC